MLAFALLVSLATALLFGLLPAIRAARIDPLPALKAGPGARGRVAFRLGRTLVVSQVAVSLVLLVGAGLFVRSLIKLERIETGFDPDSVLLFQLAPTQPAPLAERREMYRQLVARAESVPGVAAASASAVSLFMGESWGNVISVDGYQPPPGVTQRTFVNAITPRHFDVMQTGILRGRSFGAEDHETAPRVGIVNQTFARQFFGDADPIGRRLGLGAQPASTIEIVGLARDAKYLDLREQPRPMLYLAVHAARSAAARARGPHRRGIRGIGVDAAARVGSGRPTDGDRPGHDTARPGRLVACGGADDRELVGHIRPARPPAGGSGTLRRRGVPHGATHC